MATVELRLSHQRRVLDTRQVGGCELVTIGRSANCDIVIPDSTRRVSRYHAAIVRATGPMERHFVRDLGSVEGVRVGGRLVYQSLLRPGDFVEIADYRIEYAAVEDNCLRPKAHWRFVSSRESGSGECASGTAVPPSPARNLRVSEARREAVECILHASARSESLASLLQQVMALILRALDADRGFAALFSDDCESFVELGVTGCGDDQESIGIRDLQFAAKLRRGEVLLDETLLLVPLFTGTSVPGFLCLERSAFKTAFANADADYLVMLGRVAASHYRHGTDGVGAPLEWGTAMVGTKNTLMEFKRWIHEAACDRENVLLLGETGTGKDVLAREIARASGRPGPYVARNCAAIPPELADTELFGYGPSSGISNADPKGAPGCFENSHTGVLFLNELHGLTPAMQDKLLSVLEHHEIWPLGGRRPVPVDVKVIAATDKDPKQSLREPLRFRFGSVVSVQSLRERKDDIYVLAFYFLDRFASQRGTKARSISRRALDALSSYEWPGNVRELEKVIGAAVQHDTPVIASWHLPDRLTACLTDDVTKANVEAPGRRTVERPHREFPTVREIEKQMLLEALQVTHGNVTQATKLLGYKSRATTLSKMKSCGIPRNFGDDAGTE